MRSLGLIVPSFIFSNVVAERSFGTEKNGNELQQSKQIKHIYTIKRSYS